MADSPSSTNLPELSVSELASSLKRTIETTYDFVRVRGELGRVTIARSGHMYADIKDEKAVLNSVMWKGQVNALSFRPEEGLEVVAEGKLSIYAGRSNYQLIASSMRPAGAGALMALLEERKKKFAAEGLFDPAHKKRLPFLPRTIGVVTSPTGAVIRDILHRVSDRFPVRVVLWPALVQGDLAAGQIVAGITGFNEMTGDARPDVLIVGRGGGSIEDLWPFNEEAVVRAAFASKIPLISAVGHETDTTLIDYVADARAPTPTGAAEIAVPVRTELLVTTDEYGARIRRALLMRVANLKDRVRAARLPKPEALLTPKRQRFDFADAGLKRGLQGAISKKSLSLTRVSARLRPEALPTDLKRRRQRLRDISIRARPALFRILERSSDRLASQGKLLNTLSHQSVLARGFALVRDGDNRLVRSADEAKSAATLRLTFADGDAEIGATPSDRGQATSTATKPFSAKKQDPTPQGSLF
ncbi:MAG: exodeoxyribonuclease VII large subunit [Pseudomonadota bacterium]